MSIRDLMRHRSGLSIIVPQWMGCMVFSDIVSGDVDSVVYGFRGHSLRTDRVFTGLVTSAILEVVICGV